MASLKQTFYIFRRELSEYFSSPVFYVVAAAFHLLLGAIFASLLGEMASIGADPIKRSGHVGELNLSSFVLANLFDAANFLLLFISPALTMRLFAEEKRSGSFELLVATPARDWSILLGKAAAAYAAVATLALSMAIYPWMASRFGAVEHGISISAVAGLMLLGASYVAAGVFASAITDNQIIAAVAAFAILLFFALVGSIGPNSSGVWWGDLLRSISFAQRSRNFYEGLLRGEDVLYFCLFAGMGLFATARVLEARRWKR